VNFSDITKNLMSMHVKHLILIILFSSISTFLFAQEESTKKYDFSNLLDVKIENPLGEYDIELAASMEIVKFDDTHNYEENLVLKVLNSPLGINYTNKKYHDNNAKNLFLF
jgi:hypothetical protein